MITLNKSKIYKSIQNLLVYIFFLLLLVPIFISLDFSQGLLFDAYVWNKYKYPSIPLSSLILLFFSIIYYKKLLENKLLMIFTFLIFVYVIINYFLGINRTLFVGLGMLIPFYSYIVFREYLKSHKYNYYNVFFITLSIIILFKIVTDISLHYQINYLKIPVFEYSYSAADASRLYTFVKHYSITNMSTVFFGSINFTIYNYFDYFPFVYYIIIILSIYNIIKGKMTVLSILITILSILVVHDTYSRLYIYSIYLTPLLFIFYYVTKFRLDIYMYLFIFTAISITLYLGLNIIDVSSLGPSLASRYEKWYTYCLNFDVIHFLIPGLNIYRQEHLGSLHNEFLEIFSYFGLLIFFYFYLLRRLFFELNKNYSLIIYFLMFIYFIGSLIQSNFTNPYIAIISGLFFAIISQSQINDKKLSNLE